MFLVFVSQHSVQVVNTGGSFFGNAIAAFQHFWILLVDERGKISTVVENKVEALSIFESGELLLETPVVFLLGLAFPCEADSSVSVLRA